MSSLIQRDLPKLEDKLNAAADFVRNDLPQAEKQISKASSFVQHQLPDVQQGVHRVATLVRKDLPELERAIRKAAEKLREVEGNNQFAELAKLLRGILKRKVHSSRVQYRLRNNTSTPFRITVQRCHHSMPYYHYG